MGTPDLSTVTTAELLDELASRFPTIAVLLDDGKPGDDGLVNRFCRTQYPHHMAGMLLQMAVEYALTAAEPHAGNNFNPGEPRG